MYRSKLLKDASRLIKTSLRRSRSAITVEENFQREKYFLFVFARSLLLLQFYFVFYTILGIIYRGNLKLGFAAWNEKGERDIEKYFTPCN